MAEEQPPTFNWPPLESNPEVFTSYMQSLGMSSQWSIGEVFGFDEDLLGFLPQPVIGVIVALENLKRSDDRVRGSDAGDIVPFYMKQTSELDNACGIIACLHACLNNLDKVALTPGSILERFHSGCRDLSPADRATFLEDANEFKEQHASAASEGQSTQATEQNEVKHHFVAFVVNDKNQLIELDGTKVGPHVVAEGCTDVLRGGIAEIQRRLAEGDISDSLNMMTLNATP
jgi:ubiquitin carboxyl-terminal hydrolase L3